MSIEEGYIKYNEEEDIIMYWFRDGCGMSLNASDGFYVWYNGEWIWTGLRWTESNGWRLTAVPELNIQPGDKIKAGTERLDFQ